MVRTSLAIAALLLPINGYMEPDLTEAHLERRQLVAEHPIERWRPLVAEHFHPDDVDRALAVIKCESRGKPTAANPRSSARGLFQHLGRYWPQRTVRAGVDGADIFDPEAQTVVAAWLVYRGGGWSHWNPTRNCWKKGT